MKRFALIFGLGTILLLFNSCTKDSATENNNNNNNGGTLNCSSVPKSFSADVNPIIQANCATATCHASGSINGPGALISYSSISANKSMIRSAVASGTMPQGSVLSTAKINSILCWIDSGAPNN